MAFLCVVALLLQAQDLPARVAEQVPGLKSENPQVRSAATTALVRLGRRAIPVLEAVQSDDPEVRSRLLDAVSRIRAADPFFFVRSHERRVSFSFRELPYSEAHDKAFSGFPVAVTGTTFLHSTGRRVSLTVEQAGFWEVVEKFAEAANTDIIGGPAGLGYTHEHPFPTYFRLSRHGRFLLAYNAGRGLIAFNLFTEPGLEPVAVSFKLDRVTDAAGNSILTKVTLDKNLASLSHETPIGGARLGMMTVPKGILSGVDVDGTVTVDLATDVEAAEIRGPDETHTFSECRYRVTGFKRQDESFRLHFTSEGLKGWKAPEGRSHLSRVWVILADDEGRSKVITTLPYGGAVDRGTGAGWAIPQSPTRAFLIRPTEVERVQIPVRFRGITVPD
jgi:hypothetical protein